MRYGGARGRPNASSGATSCDVVTNAADPKNLANHAFAVEKLSRYILRAIGDPVRRLSLLRMEKTFILLRQ